MAFETISNATVIINDETISFVPNSLTHDLGLGEINVRAASSGGGNVESVHSVNAESKIGRVKLDIYPGPEADNLVIRWAENIGANTIRIVANLNQGQRVYSYRNMSLVMSPEFANSADGVASLEFAGDPGQVG